MAIEKHEKASSLAATATNNATQVSIVKEQPPWTTKHRAYLTLRMQDKYSIQA
jgi:hypothetical protein